MSGQQFTNSAQNVPSSTLSSAMNQPSTAAADYGSPSTAANTDQKSRSLRLSLKECRKLMAKNDVKIFNRSDDSFFRLAVYARQFKKHDFVVKTNGRRLVIEASSEKADDYAKVRFNILFNFTSISFS